jgi:proteic killer suppression protein
MDIAFRDDKLRTTCNTLREARGRLGTVMAKKLFQRLDELRAANTLADMRSIPAAHCHELTGDRKGQLAVDLKQPYRLIFVVANDPVPRKEDGGLDWQKVTAIEIVKWEDYHGS